MIQKLLDDEHFGLTKEMTVEERRGKFDMYAVWMKTVSMIHVSWNKMHIYEKVEYVFESPFIFLM
jgi:hypothetical protein